MFAIVTRRGDKVRIFIGPYELITFPEFSGNVIPILMSCDFSANPSMLVSRRCRGSVQSRRRGPGLAACVCLTGFR
jgi:hypothetical protein